MSQPFFGKQHFPSELLPAQATNILEFDAFEQIPDTFLRIEFGSVCRQLFQMKAFGSAFAEIVFHRLTAMNGGSVPDHEQLARNLAREQLQKTHHIGAFVRVILALHDDLSFWRDATHDRKMIARQLHFQDGRLSDRRIGPYAHGQQVKSRLIGKDYCPVFLRGLFFRAGHRSAFQAAMAASSRWLAFSMGFCRLCLTVRRSRLQWAG
jgi:hypothetical protein